MVEKIIAGFAEGTEWFIAKGIEGTIYIIINVIIGLLKTLAFFLGEHYPIFMVSAAVGMCFVIIGFPKFGIKITSISVIMYILVQLY